MYNTHDEVILKDVILEIEVSLLCLLLYSTALMLYYFGL